MAMDQEAIVRFLQSINLATPNVGQIADKASGLTEADYQRIIEQQLIDRGNTPLTDEQMSIIQGLLAPQAGTMQPQMSPAIQPQVVPSMGTEEAPSADYLNYLLQTGQLRPMGR